MGGALPPLPNTPSWRGDQLGGAQGLTTSKFKSLGAKMVQLNFLAYFPFLREKQWSYELMGLRVNVYFTSF
jgi:hypothetical protein